MLSNIKMEASIVFQDELPILVDESLNFSTVYTFSRGFHIYMKDWSPKIDEVLEVVKEAENECDASAVAFKRNNSVSSYIVRHIDRHISKVIFQFLSLPGSAASAIVSGMRVNRGAGDGLEIPITVKFIGHSRYIVWITKK